MISRVCTIVISTKAMLLLMQVKFSFHINLMLNNNVEALQSSDEVKSRILDPGAMAQ